MDWLVLTYRLVSEPSRHRVAVWRELRRAGAVSLQQATWAMPDRRDFVEALERAVALIERADGEAIVVRATPRSDADAAALERAFSDAREAEWREFLAECAKFEKEVRKEIRIRKFTAAELDEEEQSLDRLHRWFRDIRKRDVFLAPSAPSAELRLKECDELLERFAERVYRSGRSR